MLPCSAANDSTFEADAHPYAQAGFGLLASSIELELRSFVGRAGEEVSAGSDAVADSAFQLD